MLGVSVTSFLLKKRNSLSWEGQPVHPTLGLLDPKTKALQPLTTSRHIHPARQYDILQDLGFKNEMQDVTYIYCHLTRSSATVLSHTYLQC